MKLSQCLPRCLYLNYPPLQQTLTVAGWVTAWPCTISLAGTHAVFTQYVASVTRVRDSCTHKCLVLSLWVVVQHSISDVWKETTVLNYSTNDVIIMILVGIHMYRLCLVQALDERRNHVYTCEIKTYCRVASFRSQGRFLSLLVQKRGEEPGIISHVSNTRIERMAERVWVCVDAGISEQQEVRRCTVHYLLGMDCSLLLNTPSLIAHCSFPEDETPSGGR